MKRIAILGTGCPKCKQLAKNVEDAVKIIGEDIEIKKITDIKDIVEYGVLSLPALAVDGKIESAGQIPSVDELKIMLG
ncbi:MAG: thioredoxin family protein [Candidatus Magnetoovum sp. WYHC-5]|nr:thioredoxin family protein [Candidatus Magnetoovum sp. WYHC-5]